MSNCHQFATGYAPKIGLQRPNLPRLELGRFVFMPTRSYAMTAATPSATPSSPHVMNTYGRLPIALSHGQG